jgi:bacterioferritin
MTRGINMAEKVLRGKLDDESRNMVGGILEKDRESIDELRTLQ